MADPFLNGKPMKLSKNGTQSRTAHITYDSAPLTLSNVSSVLPLEQFLDWSHYLTMALVYAFKEKLRAASSFL